MPSLQSAPTAAGVIRPIVRRLGAWLATAGLAATALAAADLVHIEVEAERSEGGRSIDMEFHEIERTPELSRARVLTGAGSSASATALFVLRGFCAVADSRGAKYFHARPPRDDAAGDAIHTAEFADERAAVTPARLPGAPAVAGRDAPDGVYSIDDCRLAGFVR